MNHLQYRFMLFLAGAALLFAAGPQPNSSDVVVWKPAQFVTSPPPGLTTAGEPQVVDSPYGEAMHFDGVDDGFFFPGNPLDGLAAFTVEAVFYPDADGPQAQRFVHMGHALGDRVLLETRVADGKWWLDTYIQGGESRPLIDPELVHPADQWQHVAYVVRDGHLSNYIDGKLELTAQIEYKPMIGGDTSIGVRLNRQSWFKGAIYSVRITPAALTPDQFTDVHPPTP